MFSRDEVEPGKHLDLRETKQMFPEGAVIKWFVI